MIDPFDEELTDFQSHMEAAGFHVEDSVFVDFDLPRDALCLVRGDEDKGDYVAACVFEFRGQRHCEVSRQIANGAIEVEDDLTLDMILREYTPSQPK